MNNILKHTLLFALLRCNLAEAAGPSLLYSKADIPVLLERVQSEKFKDVWKAYLEETDKMCDPSSKEYANPERADKDLDQHDYDIRGHMSGQRLTRYMQHLGLAYHLTGQAKYKDLAVRLLVAYAGAIPVIHPYHKKGFAGGRGDFMRGLAMGYDQFGEFLSPEQKQIVLRAGQGYIEDFLTEFENPKTLWVPYHNFMGVCGGAAGCLAMQLADVDPEKSKNYLARVTDRLKLWLSKGFDEQGANYEGVAYSFYGLTNATIFADALKRAGGENLFLQAPFPKLLDFYLMSALPGEKVMEARNDSGYWKMGALGIKYSTENKDGRGVWLYEPGDDADPFFFRLIWDSPVPPVSPEKFGTPLFEWFKGRGLSIWRTGWEKGDVMLSVESGIYHAVTHNQADKGHISLYGYGYRWLSDAGYGCNREPLGRCQTVAHNCVLVDGKGQSISGAELGNNGKILEAANNDVYGYALVDATEAYRENIQRTGTFEQIKTTPHMPMDHALRQCLFIRPSHGAPAYAVILDNIDQDGKKHDYTWQFLSFDNLEIEATGKNTAAVTPKAEAQKEIGPGKMFVFMDAASAPTLSSNFYDAGDGKTPMPRLQAVCQAVNPYFASVLIPTDGSVQAPDVKFEQTPETTTIHVGWPKRTDTIVWKKASLERPEITVRP